MTLATRNVLIPYHPKRSAETYTKLYIYMKYFKLEEFTRSQTAQRLNIANNPNGNDIHNIVQLVAKVLDPARAWLGHTIYITSGYRSRALNEAVGGVLASQHCTGHAADITCPSDQLQLLYHYIANTLDYDQLIYYVGNNFIHVSYVTHRKNRKQIIVKS